MDHVLTSGPWPLLVAVVLVPLIFLLAKWLAKASDDDKRENREAHAVLHKKYEDAAERLRLAEIELAGMRGRVEALKDVLPRHEFEQAMAGITKTLDAMQRKLDSWRPRSGMSGQMGAVRDQRRE